MKKLILLVFVGIMTTVTYAQNKPGDGWVIRTAKVNPQNYYGLTVGNGMIGLVTSAHPLKVDDVVLNGVYDQYGRGRVSNILKGFDFANINLAVDGAQINEGNITNYRQWLNMKNAVFTTEFDVSDKAHITYELRALRQLPYCSLIRVTVQAKKDISISPASVIQAPDVLRNVHNYYSVIERPHASIPLLTSVAESPTGKHTVAASTSFIFKKTDHPRLIHEEWDVNRHLLRFQKKVAKGDSYTFNIVGTSTTSKDYDEPRNAAERLNIYAALQGAQKLIDHHNDKWDELWKGDIQITGDLQAQKDVRFALYNLYSFARAGTSYSLSPMGLSGLGYNGHVFWDTEIWMYPPMLMLHPEIAKSLLDYRYKRLDAAKQNARSHGYKGAMFPWESAASGQEETPVWALSGPFEHHITADIGIAFWDYYRVTHDKKWLKEKGYPVIKAVANFWVSRVEKGPNGKANINNVVAADEWAENVDNNAFTNAAAKVAMKNAVKAARVLGVEPDTRWAEVADDIPILRFQDGTVKEHASYHGEDIKQADVNLLTYPLEVIRDESTIRKDAEYYEPRIGHGPAMSYSVFSVIYSRLDNAEKAYDLFKQGYQPNQVPPFGVLAESAGGTNPYFATGAGGMLQAVLSGFGGLEITDDGIEQLKTPIPDKWESLKITGVGVDDKTFISK